jgi:hypothetical protein
MKIFNAIVLFLAAVIFSASINCTIKYYDTNKLLNDYATEGFLDRDHYQVIITGKPDKDAKGLVASRESALKNAKAVMNEKIIANLVNYNLNYHLKIKNINDINNLSQAKKELSEKFQEFFQYGNMAFEYYNFDNSAVLVYRIFKEDLIDKIEAIKPSLIIKEDKKEDKAVRSK